ncbi:MAG: AbrB/MazE/SpoVT family DNA-binding domain-containing protein [Deltaproteobacteria bacterium]|nr:AbrB/MazE/SpoVT family DNA-binding domain-containing protein [Deltaproteobacteria bacterium]
MLRRITRNKQVTIPKDFMAQLRLQEGDYVDMDCDGNAIRLRAVVIQDFNDDDYKKLASKLDGLKTEPGTECNDSDSARKHLKEMMDKNAL